MELLLTEENGLLKNVIPTSGKSSRQNGTPDFRDAVLSFLNVFTNSLLKITNNVEFTFSVFCLPQNKVGYLLQE
ncbi:hypothetical protein IW16_16895 [Chryseobacterium vrystaatense]|uniref:Uncharacterized protein n=1 Tax=Chryseobacterium vrystaatense TaxID=307480 RepID=A0ABR4UJZ8_9FLAO|nr:hypothetical protein IW16_16895 [Chryseobacterium vrystaatense]